MAQCPCGSGRAYDQCCAPLIRGEASPETAPELMRARYSAHTMADMAYLQRTHDPGSSDEIDVEGTRRWAQRVQWLGMEIVAAEGGGRDDTSGTVEFIAHYRERGVRQRHHERARFQRDRQGEWLYVDAETPQTEPIRHEGPKVGRNDPCPCGSGKKYKRCCGANG